MLFKFPWGEGGGRDGEGDGEEGGKGEGDAGGAGARCDGGEGCGAGACEGAVGDFNRSADWEGWARGGCCGLNGSLCGGMRS